MKSKGSQRAVDRSGSKTVIVALNPRGSVFMDILEEVWAMIEIDEDHPDRMIRSLKNIQELLSPLLMK